MVNGWLGPPVSGTSYTSTNADFLLSAPHSGDRFGDLVLGAYIAGDYKGHAYLLYGGL